MKRIFLVLIFVVVLTGCAPTVTPLDSQVYSVQPGSTLAGIRAALNSAVGTGIYSYNGTIVFCWPFGNDGTGTAFVAVNAKSQSPFIEFLQTSGGKGNLVNVKTFKDLVAIMEEKGYVKITPSDVPEPLKSAIISSTSTLYSTLFSFQPSILILPAILIDPILVPDEGVVS